MRQAVSLLSVLVVVLAGCGSEEAASKPQACTPGASVSCTGPGSCSGFQICKSDGSGYTPCDCSGSGGAGGGSGAAGTGGASTVCPAGLKGPALVELKSPAGVRYCMDATEVTFAQYDEFLAAGVDPAKEPEPCVGGPFTYDDLTYPDCLTGLYKVPDAPARCVHWCGARAYCKWAGKRLCGRIGGGPINGKSADLTDPDVSQWFNACSAGGTQDFAYGHTEKAECTASMSAIGTAKTPAGCQSTGPEIFGLSSNAAEWEDACEPGQCLPVARPADSISPSCKGAETHNNKTRFVGFRCCHDGVNL